MTGRSGCWRRSAASCYRCFATYRDALLELADAVLRKQDRVHMLAELSLEPGSRRGHGALYGAVNGGRVDIGRLRRSLAGLPLPAWDDGRIRLTADVSNWLRPDAATSPDRLFCHCYARGRGNAQMIPGWPYSLVAALEPGRTSWTLPLDAVRLGPAHDATAVTAAQVREVVTRIIAAGHWRDGDMDILVVFDAGYDLTRLAWLLAGLPVEVLGPAAQRPGAVLPRPPRPAGASGRPARHGAAFELADERSWPAPAAATVTQATRYAPPGPRPGTGCTSSWPAALDRKTTTASCRSSRAPSSGCRSITCPATAGPDRCAVVLTRSDLCRSVNRAWQAPAPLRADTGQVFSRFSAGPGPGCGTRHAADRWTWLVIACYVQLRLARRLAADLRLPWQPPCPHG